MSEAVSGFSMFNDDGHIPMDETGGSASVSSILPLSMDNFRPANSAVRPLPKTVFQLPVLEDQFAEVFFEQSHMRKKLLDGIQHLDKMLLRCPDQSLIQKERKKKGLNDDELEFDALEITT